MSNVHLTENCGLIENLIPRYVILVDRVGMYCAEVQGMKQLSQCKADTSC